MTTELATTASGTLALRGDQIEWTPLQRAALAHIGIEDAPEADQQVFRHVAQRTGLDPFAKQIHMIGRRQKQDDGSYKLKWTIQTGIDGFRLIAERHPRFAGTLDPEWCGPDGVWHDAWVHQKPPVAARVKVLRHDRAHPIALPVRFVEFAATFKNGDLQGQWAVKPAHMIGKVAEAASLRKAFPQDFSGVYIPEEMDRDDHTPAYGTTRVVEGRVTADELTGAPARDWDAEVTAAIRAADVDTLRDLWRQADGHDDVRDRIATAVQALKQPPGPPVDAEIVDADTPLGVTTEQHRHMHALWAKGEVTDRAERLTITALLVGHPVGSSSELTAAEADTVIAKLREHDKGAGALYRQVSRWLEDAAADTDEQDGSES